MARGLRLDDISCNSRKLALCFLLVKSWVRRELRLEEASFEELVLFT